MRTIGVVAHLDHDFGQVVPQVLVVSSAVGVSAGRVDVKVVLLAPSPVLLHQELVVPLDKVEGALTAGIAPPVAPLTAAVVVHPHQVALVRAIGVVAHLDHYLGQVVLQGCRATQLRADGILGASGPVLFHQELVAAEGVQVKAGQAVAVAPLVSNLPPTRVVDADQIALVADAIVIADFNGDVVGGLVDNAHILGHDQRWSAAVVAGDCKVQPTAVVAALGHAVLVGPVHQIETDLAAGRCVLVSEVAAVAVLVHVHPEA